jgi:two-component system response regulator FixJ
LSNAVVHIVDDDADVRLSLQTLLDVAGYRCLVFSSGEAFLSGREEAPRSCAIVDVRMPGMDGLVILSALARAGAKLPVIMMTGFGDVALAVRAMKAGAVDFLEKPFRFPDLTAAIDRALALTAPAGDVPQTENGLLSRLTAREREVFERLVAGDSNNRIARTLNISARTVEIHRARVMEKLQVKNLPDLVRLALRP